MKRFMKKAWKCLKSFGAPLFCGVWAATMLIFIGYMLVELVEAHMINKAKFNDCVASGRTHIECLKDRGIEED